MEKIKFLKNKKEEGGQEVACYPGYQEQNYAYTYI